MTRKIKRTRRNYRSRNIAGNDWGKRITFILLMCIGAGLLLLAKKFAFDLVLTTVSHKPTQGDFAGHLIHESINLHHSIQENPNNKERLLRNLSDPVKWYGPKPTTHAQLRLGSQYDRFYYVNELQYDRQSFQENNYEVRFDGMYRYRHPKEALVAFESATAVIERGKITELMPYQSPNRYRHGWINVVYRHYWLVAFALGFLGALIFLNLSHLPDDIRQWIWRRVQKILGLI